MRAGLHFADHVEDWRLEVSGRTAVSAKHELLSKLLKGGYIGGYIRESYRVH